MNGFLLVDKPIGLSSFGALQQLNKKFSIQRRAGKIGHGGTLDPYASGLLVIAIGKATRFLRYFLGSDKRYIADIKFGERTSSDDVEGEIIATADYSHIHREQVEAALSAFQGKIMQVPPTFSAVHVDGKRAYLLARKGRDVDIPAREIDIRHIEILDCKLPDEPFLQLDIECSGGTYIRSIARDLGQALGSEAHLNGLRRTNACHFEISQAKTLDFLMAQDDIESFIHPCAEAMNIYPEIRPSAAKLHRLFNGLPVNFNISKDGIYTLKFRDELVAVLERKDGKNDFLRLFSDIEFKELEKAAT
ncbi:MAG: tRNA pseudouridine(55) synthase TruB [Proteobacteria bacterium]|nr:tRNA pseudouridine(55) synthase TruB [Pseudomonadota bacterium]